MISLLLALACAVVFTGAAIGFGLGLVYSKWYWDGSERTGRRQWAWVRRLLRSWPVRRYFSFRLDTSRYSGQHFPEQAIYAFHPHGLFSVTPALTAAASNSPPILMAVHRTVFAVPLLRELALWGGCIDVARENIIAALSNGHSVGLVPGGTREMAVAHHRELDIQIVHTGFLQIAWETGIPVVPIFSCGENRAWLTLPWFRRMREFFNRLIGYPFPSFFLGPIPTRITAYYGLPLLPAHYSTESEFRRAYLAALAALVRECEPRDSLSKDTVRWMQSVQEEE